MTAKFSVNIPRRLFSKTRGKKTGDWKDLEYWQEFMCFRKSIKTQAKGFYKK